jgi:hypothetical protein
MLTVFFVIGFLAIDSHAGCYRGYRAYRTGPAVVVAPRPYRRYYSPAPVVYLPPAPLVYLPPAPVVYPQPLWVPGINVFFPGVNIRVW